MSVRRQLSFCSSRMKSHFRTWADKSKSVPVWSVILCSSSMMAVLSVVCSEAQAADRRTKQAAKNCFFMDVWLNDNGLQRSTRLHLHTIPLECQFVHSSFILNFTSFVYNHSRLGIVKMNFASALGLTAYFF